MEEQPHSEAHREPSREAGREGHRESHSDEARWMTFQELAAIRGTSKRAAVTLIRRHGWRRQRDNQNRVIALVPLTWATTEDVGEAHETSHSDAHREAHNGPVGQSHAAAFETALAAIEAAHARELAVLGEQVASAEQLRLELQAMVEQFAGQLRDADQIMKAERARSDALLADAQISVDRAEAAIAAERQRADDLRTQIDELKAGQALMIDTARPRACHGPAGRRGGSGQGCGASAGPD